MARKKIKIKKIKQGKYVYDMFGDKYKSGFSKRKKK